MTLQNVLSNQVSGNQLMSRKLENLYIKMNCIDIDQLINNLGACLSKIIFDL